MKIVYVNKKHQCRMATLDEAENRFWIKPHLRERLLEKRRVGFDLDQIESIKEVAAGVDEQGLYAITAALKTAGQRGEDVSNSLIYTSL